MELNAEQLLAATHPPGEAALLLAGAGSGKTATMTERIAWLISQGVTPRRILAITFTNKAAHEIAERVSLRLAIPPEVTGPRVTTIHSLALSMIRKNPPGFGLKPNMTLLDDYYQGETFKDLIARLVQEIPELAEDRSLNIFRIRESISFHRARGLGFVCEYTEEVHERALKEYAGQHALTPNDLRLWKDYEETKKNCNQVDFDDLLHLVVRRGREDHDWRDALQRVFAHVLVDEAQDVNRPQWDLINLLLGPENRNLLICGDLGQSIYGFNGAQPGLIRAFSEDWRGAPPTLYRIVRNHRSVPEIVNLANAIQGKFSESLPLVMESYRGDHLSHRGSTRLVQGDSPRDIATSIAQHIRGELVQRPGATYRDFCILIRSSMQLRDIEGELVKARIPYIVRGGRGLLQTEEVRDVLSYLRLATNPMDLSAFKRATSVPRRGVGEKSIEAISFKARRDYGGDLVKAARQETKLASFADTIQVIQARAEDPVTGLETAILMSHYHDYLRKKYAKEPDKVATKIENLGRLREMIEGIVEDTVTTTEDLVFQLTLDKVDEDDPDGKVTISTIHAAKGLEWHTVWITNCYENSLPHKWSMGSDSEVEEERRLFYVAATRPRDHLRICVPARVVLRTERGYEGVRNIYGDAEPSRFLRELGIIKDRRV